VRVVHFFVGVLAFWGLFYLSARTLLLDILRQRLFAIRDDLFDFAADGGIEFGNPIYRELREDINNFIRFAHKLSFARMIFGPWGMPDDHPAMVSIRNWTESANQLEPLAKRKLFEVRAEVLQEVVKCIVRRSLVVYLLVSSLRLIGLFTNTVRTFNEKLPKFAEALEAQARDEYRYAT
ncbi:MAG TPA: hypothetical protein VNF29_12600, partial [Candidatus Binataceae bacterium]|nr:hypothetical protein [Candidatus Binataceae bacterium]